MADMDINEETLGRREIPKPIEDEMKKCSWRLLVCSLGRRDLRAGQVSR